MLEQMSLPGLEPIGQLEHYNSDTIVHEFQGAGPLAFMTRDQLHPPMIDDEEMWRAGKWYEGALRHTRDAARLLGLSSGMRVLDIGCGIGGPARTLASLEDVTVVGIANASVLIESAKRLTNRRPDLARRVTFHVHDATLRLPENLGRFSAAWCMNMCYHVEDKILFFQNTHDALDENALFLLDDWMLTPRANDADRDTLGYHFMSRHFLVREEAFEQLHAAGFRVVRFRDLGHVGRALLGKYFPPVFDTHFAEQISRAYGEDVVRHFRRAISETVRLYREERLTYCQFVALRQ